MKVLEEEQIIETFEIFQCGGEDHGRNREMKVLEPPHLEFIRSKYTEVIREDFLKLAEAWHKDTDYQSSIQRKTGHPAYLKIISMGKAVVPFILQELQKRGGHWFIALSVITGADPVPSEHYGDMEKVTEDWLGYGKEQGLIL